MFALRVRWRGRTPRVSVHAMFLSLGRFGIATADQTRALKKAVAAKRKKGGLDLDGKEIQSQDADVAICAHQ